MTDIVNIEVDGVEAYPRTHAKAVIGLEKYIGEISNTGIPDGSITPEKLSFIKSGKNYYDPKQAIFDGFITPSNGKWSNNESYITTGKITVKAQEVWTISTAKFVTFWDQNGNVVSTAGITYDNKKLTFSVPELAVSFQASVYKSLATSLQIEKGPEQTSYEPYTKQFLGIQISENDVVKGIANLEVNLPKKIFGTVGEELRIYTANLLRENQTYNIKYGASVGKQMKDYFCITPPEAGEADLSLQIFDKDSLVFDGKTKVVVSPMKTKKVKGLVIGDSTIEGNFETKRLLDKLGSNLELVGTRGTAPNLHEGRGGWRFSHYLSTEELSGVKNAFYNPEKKSFDFGYYMQQQNYSDLDFVFIQLGINDVFSYASDLALETAIPSFFNQAALIVKSILEYDQTIKVGLGITFPPTSDADAFGTTYGVSQVLWRYKYNNYLWVKRLMEKYQNEAAVTLVPLHISIDTKTGFRDGVHPNEAGYYQLGDQLLSWINSL